MGSGNFYLQPVKTNRNVKRGRSLRSILLAGALFVGLPFASMAQPTFVGGSMQSVTVCANSGANDITGYLSVNDPIGLPTPDNDTWDISVAPANGTLSGFSQVQPSNGGTLSFPSNTFTYTPNPSVTGSDMFVIKVYDDVAGDTVYKTFNIVITPLPSFHIDAIPAVCAGATSTSLFYSSLSQLGAATNTYTSPGGGIASWQVPPGVSSVDFDVQGAVGGNDNHSVAGTSNPGAGARVQGTLGGLTTGNILNLYWGGAGGNGTVSGATGGFNGGGNATFYFFGSGGAGGGASDIRLNGSNLSDRVVVAGGGGGNGWDAPGPSCGGFGAYPVGGAGCANVSGGHAGGGNTTALSGGAAATYPGWTTGQNGSLGNGGNGSVQGISGGGGGGYYGGGGGLWSGGGGGSSYTNGSMVTAVTNTSNYNIGGGSVSITYNIPGTYEITWFGTAPSEGFANVTGATFPTGGAPISIAVPPTATPGTYTGEITISNLTCSSVSYPISITINPIPSVDDVTNVSYCNGDATTPVIFTGSVPGTTFNWTNDNTSIGLTASGSGNLSSFTATNTGTAPSTGIITVTPVANGCSGAPMSFTITANPTPILTSTLTPPAICDSTLFSYTPTSATAGTSFTWYRPGGLVSVGGSTASASGVGDPALSGEWLDNTTPTAVVVPYTYVLAANGCLNSQVVNVTVYPQPVLSSALSAGAICNSTLFGYVPTSLTSGVDFTWNRNFITGISNTAATGSNSPNEILNNTTTDPIAVPYLYTLSLHGTSCIDQQTVIVTVNPTPVLNTLATPSPVCNNTTFTYNPGSSTTGTSFSWARNPNVGISTPVNSGIGNISESLNNTTPNPVAVIYTYTLTANGCAHTQNVTETVYPTPRLSSPLTATVCDSALFDYTPMSGTSGTTFTWTRAAVSGITNLANAGVNNPMEYLNNTTSNPVTVTYVYALSANGCGPYNQNVSLTVNPKPMLSSSLTPPAICDSTTFSYNPTSATAGSTFAWERPYIPGIYAVQQTGTGNPNQELINSTYVVVNVTYVYTVTANGCSNVQSVVVPVNPTPKLNPPFSETVCSGYPFTYTPTSYTPGASFAWDRPQVPHVGPATSFTGVGTGTINETLVTDQMTPVNTYYYYRLGINGCTNLYTQTVKLTINPTPAPGIISTSPSSTLCAGSMFQSFGVSNVQDGVDYTWTATNGTVVEQGAQHQFALVNFMNPGPAVVTVTADVNGFSCGAPASFNVTVTGGENALPPVRVVYYNGQFICLENSNLTYQWGYDDAHTLKPTVLTGQIDQNYNNPTPDFANKNYWVMVTTAGGCTQKSYYNAPTGISNVNNNEVTDMTVYPNPASQLLNVEITSTLGGNIQVEVMNLIGQKLSTTEAVNNKATVDVSALPAGCYLVNCYRNGEKVATTKFVKN